MNSFFKKTIALTLIIGLFLPILSYIIVPKPAQAVLGVLDQVFDIQTEWATTAVVPAANGTTFSTGVSAAQNTLSRLKEYVLVPLVRMTAQMLIRKITADTVTWINNGFKGSPAFLNNPGQFFSNTADEVLGEYLFGFNADGPLGWLCSPFGADIQLTLTQRFYNNQPPKCKLSDAIKNSIDSVKNNFHVSVNTVNTGGTVTYGAVSTANGGSQTVGNPAAIANISWDAYMTGMQDPTQNASGAFAVAENKVITKLISATNAINEDLNRGMGFLSWSECKPASVTQGECLQYEQTAADNIVNANSNTAGTFNSTNKSTGANTSRTCKKRAQPGCAPGGMETKTPGSVIEKNINEVLPAGLNQLEMARELNEVFSALLGQVIKQVLGGAGGLLAMGQKNSSGVTNIDAMMSAENAAQQASTQQVVDDYQAQQDQQNQMLQSQQRSFSNGGRVVFSSINNNTVYIYKNTHQPENNNFDATYTYYANMIPFTNAKIVLSLIDQKNSTNGPANYISLNTVFDNLSLTLNKQDRANSSSTNEIILNQTSVDTGQSVINVGDNVVIDNNYLYGLGLTGKIKDSSILKVGNYMLRAAIEDQNGTVQNYQDIIFSVNSL